MKRQDERQHIAMVNATQDINAKLATEVTGLRDQIRNEEQTRDQLFGETLKATGEFAPGVRVNMSRPAKCPNSSPSRWPA